MRTRRIGIVMASLALAFVLGGCVDAIKQDILEIRREMMMSSLLFCSSQYQAVIGDRFDLSVGFDGENIKYGHDVQRYWNGILADPEFRQFLIEADIDPIEFQATVSKCQREWLERRLLRPDSRAVA